jgi:hypothetical protein
MSPILSSSSSHGVCTVNGLYSNVKAFKIPHSFNPKCGGPPNVSVECHVTLLKREVKKPRRVHSRDTRHTLILSNEGCQKDKGKDRGIDQDSIL